MIWRSTAVGLMTVKVQGNSQKFNIQLRPQQPHQPFSASVLCNPPLPIQIFLHLLHTFASRLGLSNVRLQWTRSQVDIDLGRERLCQHSAALAVDRNPQVGLVPAFGRSQVGIALHWTVGRIYRRRRCRPFGGRGARDTSPCLKRCSSVGRKPNADCGNEDLLVWYWRCFLVDIL